MTYKRRACVVAATLLAGAFFFMSGKYRFKFDSDRSVFVYNASRSVDNSQSCWNVYNYTMKKDEVLHFIAGKTVMMDPKSVKMLCNILQPHMSVLEWGSGGSTLFFSRFVKKWYSLEHDARWGAHMMKYINTSIHLDVVPIQWTSSIFDGDYETFRAYVERPATYSKRFDIIIVDGRARVHCARSVLRNNLLASRDSRVVIHDWERPKFKTILDEFDIDAEETTERRHLGVLKQKVKNIGLYPRPHDVFPMVHRLVYIGNSSQQCNRRLEAIQQAQHFDQDRIESFLVSDLQTTSRLWAHISALKHVLTTYPGENVLMLDGELSFINRQSVLEQQFWYLWEHAQIAKSWSLVLLSGTPRFSSEENSPQNGVSILKAVHPKSLPFNGYAVKSRHIEKLITILDILAKRSKGSNIMINLPTQWYSFDKPMLKMSTLQ